MEKREFVGEVKLGELGWFSLGLGWIGEGS